MSTSHLLNAQVQFNSSGLASSGFPHDLFNLLTTSTNWVSPQQVTLTSSAVAVFTSPFSNTTNWSAVILRNTGANTLSLSIENTAGVTANGTAIDIQSGGCLILFGTTTPGTFPSGGTADLTKWQWSSASGTTALVAACWS